MTNVVSNSDLQNLTLYCPVNCHTVKANNKKQFPIPGGQATWWHCPECLGWHVSIREGEEMVTIQMADMSNLKTNNGWKRKAVLSQLKARQFPEK